MKSVERGLPKDFDKSFTVFEEIGTFFPFPYHYHSEYELVLVLKSTGRRLVGDHIGYFSPDDLVFMGSHLPHIWINDPTFLKDQAGYPAEAIVIHFNDDFLGKSFFEIPEMEAFKNFLSKSNRGMVIKGKTRETINTLMKGMPGMNGLERLSALLSIFNILSQTSEYEQLASPGFIQSMDLNVSNRFSKITSYIIQNFDKDISLPEVASVANMAVTTFCNFFKEHYRVTFVEYLNSVRIGHACKLLTEEDQNIIEISYKSGFKNLANFNRQFKKHKDMTPTKYRKTVNMSEEGVR